MTVRPIHLTRTRTISLAACAAAVTIAACEARLPSAADAEQVPVALLTPPARAVGPGDPAAVAVDIGTTAGSEAASLPRPRRVEVAKVRGRPPVEAVDVAR